MAKIICREPAYAKWLTPNKSGLTFIDNWTPELNSVKLYELFNDKKNINPQTSLVLSDDGMIYEDALIYIIFGGKHNYSKYNKHNNPPRMLKFPEIGCLENKSLQRWEEMFDKIAK